MPTLATESDKIDSLVQGSAAVSAPSAVKTGESFQVVLRVSPDNLNKLMSNLKDDFPENETVKGKPGVKLTPRMKASVTGIGFNITASDDPIQAISYKDDTTWAWQVVAVQPGHRTLTFSLAGTLNVEGKEVARNFYQYRQKVQVEVDPMGFFEKYWQWLTTTLLIPAFGAVWAFYRKRENSTVAPGQTVIQRLREKHRLRNTR